ncbi:MAG: hypothetical protein QM706_07640 [Nitrospira sp.]
MKVVLDIETVQAPREEWARLAGKSPPLFLSRSCRKKIVATSAGEAS